MLQYFKESKLSVYIYIILLAILIALSLPLSVFAEKSSTVKVIVNVVDFTQLNISDGVVVVRSNVPYQLITTEGVISGEPGVQSYKATEFVTLIGVN